MSKRYDRMECSGRTIDCVPDELKCEVEKEFFCSCCKKQIFIKPRWMIRIFKHDGGHTKSKWEMTVTRYTPRWIGNYNYYICWGCLGIARDYVESFDVKDIESDLYKLKIVKELEK